MRLAFLTLLITAPASKKSKSPIRYTFLFNLRVQSKKIMMQPFCTIIKKFLKRHSTVIQVSQTPDLVKVCLCSIQVYTNKTRTTQETCWNCLRTALNRRAYSEFSQNPSRILQNSRTDSKNLGESYKNF